MMTRRNFVGGSTAAVMGTALVYIGLQLSFLYQTLALLVAAYVMRFLPLAVGSIRSTAESMDGSLVKSGWRRVDRRSSDRT